MTTTTERVYKRIGHVSLEMTLVKPTDWSAHDRRPGMLFFHGGGWRSGVRGQFMPHCRHFAEAGWVTATAAYRLRGEHDVLPTECVSDARSAMRFFRSHAPQFGIDAQRIVAGGGSAGGHLAACLATDCGADEPGEDEAVNVRPCAALLFNPVVDITDDAWQGAHRKAWIDDLLTRLGERVEGICPVLHIDAETPPTIIFHGDADATVPPSHVRRFDAAMREAGRPCELVLYPGQGHGFFNYGRDEGRHYTDTIARAERFLAEVVGIDQATPA